MSNIKILPHPHVQVKEWDIDNYPAVIEVRMSNNTVQKYVRHIEPPQPAFQRCIELIDKLPVYGPSAKGYKGRHEKK